MEKKFDIKNILIIALGIALIISFMFAQKNSINTNKDEIKKLEQENTSLLNKNDSLKVVNVMLDSLVTSINKQLNENATKLANSQLEINKLNKRKDEIPTYVNNLSANGVSNAFSDYLQTRTEGTNTRK